MTFAGEPIINALDAKARGLRPLTSAYALPAEAAMLFATIADMRRCHSTFALVEAGKGVEVWRGAPASDCSETGENSQ
jgi:hypothetical protein